MSLFSSFFIILSVPEGYEEAGNLMFQGFGPSYMTVAGVIRLLCTLKRHWRQCNTMQVDRLIDIAI